jgi:hypothetical protein
MKLTKSITFLLVLPLFINFSQGKEIHQNQQAVDDFKQMSTEILEAKNHILEQKYQEMAIKFITHLNKISFKLDPSENSENDKKKPSVGIMIRESTILALNLLNSKQLTSKLDKKSDDLIDNVFDIFLSKINSAIDSKWEWNDFSEDDIYVTGYPSSDFGIDPNSISDPELKKRNIESRNRIQHNNLKNGQQRDLRTFREMFLTCIARYASAPDKKIDIEVFIERFGKDEESKEIINKNLNN